MDHATAVVADARALVANRCRRLRRRAIRSADGARGVPDQRKPVRTARGARPRWAVQSSIPPLSGSQVDAAVVGSTPRRAVRAPGLRIDARLCRATDTP